MRPSKRRATRPLPRSHLYGRRSWTFSGPHYWSLNDLMRNPDPCAAAARCSSATRPTEMHERSARSRTAIPDTDGTEAEAWNEGRVRLPGAAVAARAVLGMRGGVG